MSFTYFLFFLLFLHMLRYFQNKRFRRSKYTTLTSLTTQHSCVRLMYNTEQSNRAIAYFSKGNNKYVYMNSLIHFWVKLIIFITEIISPLGYKWYILMCYPTLSIETGNLLNYHLRVCALNAGPGPVTFRPGQSLNEVTGPAGQYEQWK